MTRQRNRSAPLSALYVSPLTQPCWPPPSICCQALSTPPSFAPRPNTTSVLVLPSPQKGEGGRFSWMGTTAHAKRYVCFWLWSVHLAQYFFLKKRKEIWMSNEHAWLSLKHPKICLPRFGLLKLFLEKKHTTKIVLTGSRIFSGCREQFLPAYNTASWHFKNYRKGMVFFHRLTSCS